MLKASDPNPCTLSAREAEILRLLTNGRPNTVVASELGLSEAAVRDHITSVLDKVRAKRSSKTADAGGLLTRQQRRRMS
jgi:DNA-binding NarL/FixJ family response regulator